VCVPIYTISFVLHSSMVLASLLSVVGARRVVLWVASCPSASDKTLGGWTGLDQSSTVPHLVEGWRSDVCAFTAGVLPFDVRVWDSKNHIRLNAPGSYFLPFLFESSNTCMLSHGDEQRLLLYIPNSIRSPVRDELVQPSQAATAILADKQISPPTPIGQV